jgi:beta-N-acetylhexosaminidase
MLGRRTALAMRRLGINVDLAPVADVPSTPASFIAKADRGFSRDPGRVARAATAFARGLRDGGVLATAKHFPGLGAATVNTDAASVTLTATARDIAPFQALIAADVPLIMLSNAAYTNLGSEPASRSARVIGLLRGTYRFRGVTITDALRPATTTSALRSVRARADIVLAITDERQSAAICRAMVAAAMHGEIPTQQLRRSYARIASLKRSTLP